MVDQASVQANIEDCQEAAELHRLITEAKKETRAAWYKMGKTLLEIKEKGVWKTLIAKEEHWIDYLASRDVCISRAQLSRLIRWMKVAEQIGLDEEDHIKVSESKILRLLLMAVKYEPDKITVLNTEKVRELFFDSINSTWKDFERKCKLERERIDPNQLLKKDLRFKRFRRGYVYDGHGQYIGFIDAVSGHGKRQYVTIRLDNDRLSKQGPIQIMIPEKLRLYPPD